jgi:hypothetical protein
MAAPHPGDEGDMEEERIDARLRAGQGMAANGRASTVSSVTPPATRLAAVAPSCTSALCITRALGHHRSGDAPPREQGLLSMCRA